MAVIEQITDHISGGFANPVFDAQAIFRAVMDAMARPGTVKPVKAETQPPRPLSPVAAAIALTICDNDTSNRCTPARLEVFRENLGFNNPWYEEYGKFMKGVVAGREIQFGSTKVFECPAPCLGYSYRTKAPVFEEMKERMPATFSVAIGGAFLYLTVGIPIGVAAAMGVSQILSSVLFGVSPADPVALLGACVVVAGIAFTAGVLPARRAARFDPSRTLHYE